MPKGSQATVCFCGCIDLSLGNSHIHPISTLQGGVEQLRQTTKPNIVSYLALSRKFLSFSSGAPRHLVTFIASSVSKLPGDVEIKK
jgi:hypothetical protein